jgi:RNAse (barnase) inhibitor barstar
MDKNTVIEINNRLWDALTADLEHGVKCLNENASASFNLYYPRLNDFISWLNEIEDDLTKDDE